MADELEFFEQISPTRINPKHTRKTKPKTATGIYVKGDGVRSKFGHHPGITGTVESVFGTKVPLYRIRLSSGGLMTVAQSQLERNIDGK